MVATRVFLVDDHAVVRAGLRALIGQQPEMSVVGEAGDGLTACAAIPAAAPDVAVVDMSMPGMTGAEVTERLRLDCPAVKVLAMTVHDESGYLHRLTVAGVRGYILKRAAADELVHAIRVVASGGYYLDPALTGRVLAATVRGPSANGAAGEALLSAREIEVVRLIAFGYSTKEIASQLDVSAKSIDTYRSRAMEKLEVRTKADLVRYAIHRGWLQDQ